METIKLDPFTRLLSINFTSAAWVVVYVNVQTGNNAVPPDGTVAIDYRVQNGFVMPGGSTPMGENAPHIVSKQDVAGKQWAMQQKFLDPSNQHVSTLQCAVFNKLPAGKAFEFGITGRLDVHVIGGLSLMNISVGVIDPAVRALKLGDRAQWTVPYEVGFPLPFINQIVSYEADISDPFKTFTFQIAPDLTLG